ncbi:MAG: GreA/GreB family elongation factor [Rhizobacter sp.]|nr:GreA/GreB family elongation factor [Rhizobacter sp.]
MDTLTLERTLTELDHVRITHLLQRGHRDGLPLAETEHLESLLDDAAIVPSREISPEVVTMNTQVLLQDTHTGERSTLTVCYPADADPETGRVSVLSPAGWSVLGLRVGDTAQWPKPSGGLGSARIVGIVFQPEASGDYLM